METFEKITQDKAMKIIGGKNTFIDFMVNFENNSLVKNTISYSSVHKLIKTGKTIFFNEDEFLSHLQIYICEQLDERNIVANGIMHDIMIVE